MGMTRVGIAMWKDYHHRLDPSSFRQSFVDHLKYSIGKDHTQATELDLYHAVAMAVRDRLLDRMMATAATYKFKKAKRMYYLSLEFLMGRSLENNLVNLGFRDKAAQALGDLGLKFEDIAKYEEDAGLGNGGLGRLAACFLDSLATLGYPGFGYGLRYDYGIFRQEIQNGWQVECPDHWLRYGNPWEIIRPHHQKTVRLYGRVIETADDHGNFRPQWVDGETVLGVPYDQLIVGYGTNTVNLLRLWSAKASEEFNFQIFNSGDYENAVREKNESETISKVLYPNDDFEEGKELRLKQEYFFVSCSMQDILERFERDIGTEWEQLPEFVAVQLNDTHPALAIPELMRLLVDEKHLEWDRAWAITGNTFGYTNHTLLPEALEKWPVSLMARVLPRHLQIVYEINHRFLETVRMNSPGDNARVAKLSLIEEFPRRQVRMANLCVVGSHHVNGVAALHTKLIKSHLMPEFAEYFPEKFTNKTNGITPRRWLLSSNPGLSGEITHRIGPDWITDLDRLRELEPHLNDSGFRDKFRLIKLENKTALAGIIKNLTGVSVDPQSIFDVHVKRLHEYKRQLLNILHVVHLYNRLRHDSAFDMVPHTFIFGGKAAPGYAMAKLIIKLVNAVAARVNADPLVNERLRVVFVPNYGVSLAERIIPAADVSEQISTAGFEASGTGNMKFALNGALTIGTLDGANIEIAEEVGAENIFIFGLTADEVSHLKPTYNPWAYYTQNEDTRAALDLISSDFFNPDQPALFAPIVDSLLTHGDRYMVLADFPLYAKAHRAVDAAFRDTENWTRRAILNVARIGKFSSDRTIREYADEIWNIEPYSPHLPNEAGTQVLPRPPQLDSTATPATPEAAHE